MLTQNYKHIIWDWNGTLLDDTRLCLEIINRILQRRGKAFISHETYRTHFGFPVIKFYEFLGFDTDEDSFSEISREFISEYERRWLAECELHAEIEKLLAQIHNSGRTQSILSAAKYDSLELAVDHYKIRDYFSDIAGTDNIYAHGKIERGQRWVNEHSPLLHETLLIGDTLHDFEVAKAIGIECLLISHGHQNSHKLSTAGKPLIHNVLEIQKFLNV